MTIKRFMHASSACLLFCLILFQAAAAHATVDFCAVNHITRQCATLESGNYEPIGWVACTCGERCIVQDYCGELGYRYVGYQPWYTIELVLLLVALLGVPAFWRWRSSSVKEDSRSPQQ